MGEKRLLSTLIGAGVIVAATTVAIDRATRPRPEEPLQPIPQDHFMFNQEEFRRKVLEAQRRCLAEDPKNKAVILYDNEKNGNENLRGMICYRPSLINPQPREE